MAYTDYFDEVQELYIAYYQRPADPEGLVFWAKELDKAGGNLNGIIEAFANSAESRALYGAVIDSSNIDTVITGIYQALFNRLPDEGGLLFYHNGFIEGKFTAATIMLNILDGATGQDRDYVDNKLAAANLFTETIDPGLDGNDIQAAYTDADLVSARAYLDLVTDDPGTVPTEAEAANFIRTHIAEPGDQISGSQTFTLQEIEDEVITLPGTLVEGSQLMWGYTPEDDGIPAEDMLSFLTTITGLDLTELGLIDNDGVGPFDNVASIELELEGALETGDIETGDLTITFENGTSLSFLTDEAAISEMYFDFLTNLLFFEDPITGVLVSRLYMSDPVWVDADGNYIDGPTYTELIVGEPIVLTPQENNGGTLEEGFTTEMDTTIVAGAWSCCTRLISTRAAGMTFWKWTPRAPMPSLWHCSTSRRSRSRTCPMSILRQKPFTTILIKMASAFTAATALQRMRAIIQITIPITTKESSPILPIPTERSISVSLQATLTAFLISAAPRTSKN